MEWNTNGLVALAALALGVVNSVAGGLGAWRRRPRLSVRCTISTMAYRNTEGEVVNEPHLIVTVAAVNGKVGLDSVHIDFADPADICRGLQSGPVSSKPYGGRGMIDMYLEMGQGDLYDWSPQDQSCALDTGDQRQWAYYVASSGLDASERYLKLQAVAVLNTRKKAVRSDVVLFPVASLPSSPLE